MKPFFIILPILISLLLPKNKNAEQQIIKLIVTNTSNVTSKLFLTTKNTDTIYYLIKDIDADGVQDSVYVNPENATIVCKLSTKKFKEIASKPIEILNFPSGVVETKNGFEFFNDWMRAGYKNQFRYNKKTKQIQLIGMSRYEFGNAANDGSGESSVNLLTGDYIGNWNFYDDLANNEGGELVKIPTIKTKMYFKTINLEDFSEDVYFNYADRCSKLYYAKKQKMKTKVGN
ncbi:hypothetical protein H1R17_00520 [Flavobacterium sp. xlx-214]|uniref:hypothetical protein n=1 Tax=unclassified Flavobacterium TaxID=196869 RepID=UPI0013D1127C|nr:MULTISPECIES: hypothetical protein [unclassified Flavobacterium]MBA5791165.1 hypothetical protein [Flavobacterium sp. xlx-221]QMI83665.1 hypothetical protein H1R17_00520 [Flavobacterium sp. xlx-214]